MFSLSSQSCYYKFPCDPQTFDYVTQPRIASQYTIGGKVVQLLGSSAELKFTGQLTIENRDANYTKFQRTAENGLFLLAGRKFCLDMRAGANINLVLDSRKINVTGALTGWKYEADLETVAFTYDITFLVQQTSQEFETGNYNSLFSEITSDIGFTDKGGPSSWHGGQSSATSTWQKLQAITGLDYKTITPSASSVPSSGGMTTTQAKAYAHSVLTKYGLSLSQWGELVWLWHKESDWSWTATNPVSGAYGIAQYYGDHSAFDKKIGISWQEYRSSAKAQIDWGLQYIKARYGSIAGAYYHELEYNSY